MYKSNQQELLCEMNKSFDAASSNANNAEANGSIDWWLVQTQVWSDLGNFIKETGQSALATSWFDWSVEESEKSNVA